jgi:competence protein ComGC
MNKRGFTLLEMIFVLSVISLVFLLTIPNIQKALNLLHNKGCEAQVTLVDGAILQYELTYLNPPSSIQELIEEGYLKESQSVCQDNRSIEVIDGQADVQ